MPEVEDVPGEELLSWPEVGGERCQWSVDDVHGVGRNETLVREFPERSDAEHVEGKEDGNPEDDEVRGWEARLRRRCLRRSGRVGER